MRRVGPKGTFRFERITWDEAYGRIVDRLLRVKEESGPEAAAVYTGRGAFELSLCDMFQPKGVAVSSASSVLFRYGSPNTMGVGALCYVSFAMIAPHVTMGRMLVNMFSGGGGGTTETTNTTPTSLPTTPIGPITPIRVTCNPPSSESSSFPCTALIDGDAATSWNATDGGIGVEITFLFAPPVQITEMIIQNVVDECRFLRNARMKGIEVSIDDLTQTIVKELDDSRDPQRIPIRSIGTSSLTIRITSGYPGQTCDNKEPFVEMAAQDVYFFGRPTPGG